MTTYLKGNVFSNANQFSVSCVDGSEIRRSPVEVGSLSHYLPGFCHIPGGSAFLPSMFSFQGVFGGKHPPPDLRFRVNWHSLWPGSVGTGAGYEFLTTNKTRQNGWLRKKRRSVEMVMNAL